MTQSGAILIPRFLLFMGLALSIWDGGAVAAQERVRVGRIHLPTPAGWVVEESADLTTLAPSRSDLASPIPTGPRIRVRAAAGGADPIAALSGALQGDLRIVEPPDSTRVAGRHAVTIGVEEAGLRRRLVTLADAGAPTAYRIDLESPADRWDASVDAMEEVLAGASLGDVSRLATESDPTVPDDPPEADPITAPTPSTAGDGGGGGRGGVRSRGPGATTYALIAFAGLIVALGVALVLVRHREPASGPIHRAASGVGAKIDLRLRVSEPGRPPRTVAFERAPVTIGRSPDNNLVLADPDVSRHHAAIDVEDGRLVLVDRGSSHGTKLDGRRVSRSDLRRGSVAGLGRSTLEVA